MKEGLRQCMAWLHTWAGLVAGWVLFVVFLTGTAAYFNAEITRWMQPELPAAGISLPPAQAVSMAQTRLAGQAAGAEQWTVLLPGGRNPDLSVSWRAPARDGQRFGRFQREILDPATGLPAEAKPRTTGGGNLLYRIHYDLHYMPAVWGRWIVGICSMFMLVAIISGVITHKKIFADFFTFRPKKGQRSWLDFHNALSVLALPYHLMITYTGLVIFMFMYMPFGITSSYGQNQQQVFYDELYNRAQPVPASAGAPPLGTLAPLQSVLAQAEQAWGPGQVRSLSVQRAGTTDTVVTATRQYGHSVSRNGQLRFDGSGRPLDTDSARGNATAVHATLYALHEGHFAGWPLRWLFFLAGIVGTAMVATGLILWTVKRRPRQAKAGKTHFGHGLVECLNIGTIVGLPIGMAVYFWANRLLPIELDMRRNWEAHAMFIAWGLTLLYAVARPVMRGWRETLWAASALYLLLPLLNAVTTRRHLGVSLPAGDWFMAGFDLTMLAIGASLGYAAWTLGRRKPVAAAATARKARAAAPSATPSPAQEPA